MLTLAMLTSMYFVLHRKKRQSDADQSQNFTVQEAMTLSEEVVLYREVFSFENEAGIDNAFSLSADKANSGRRSVKLENNVEFGATVKRRLGSLAKTGKAERVKIKCFAQSDEKITEGKIVVSIDDPSGKNLFWQALSVPESVLNWTELDAEFNVSKDVNSDDNILSVYPWNPGKKIFYIDDLEISLIGKSVVRPYAQDPLIQTNFEFTFENASTDVFGKNISDDVARNGSNSLLLHPGNKSFSIIKKIEEVANADVKTVSISFWVYPLKENCDVNMVFSLKDSYGKQSIQNKTTGKMKLRRNAWNRVNARWKTENENAAAGSVFELYLINQGRGDVYIDDMLAVFGDPPPAPGGSPVISTYKAESTVLPPVNKPPFRPAYLQKLSALTMFSMGNDKADGKIGIQPGAHFHYGNFTGSAENLLILQGNTVILCNLDVTSSVPNKIIEFVTSRNYSSAIQVADIKLYDERKCLIALLEDRKSFSILCFDETGVKEKPIKLQAELQGYNHISSIDIDGKSSFEIVLMSESGKWIVLSDDGAELYNGTLNVPDLRITSLLQMKHNSSEKKLMTFGMKSGKSFSAILSWNKAAQKFQTERMHTYEYPLFNSGDKIFELPQTNSSVSYYQINNSGRRFSMRLMKYSDNRMIVLNDLDFKGYQADANPKYYEMIRVLPLYPNKIYPTSFLVFHANCFDKDYSGKSCSRFEDIDGLPNGFSIYSFQ